MIDLQKFCGPEAARAYLHTPWSQGDWTYATNGYIAVRVARRDDIPEADQQNPAAPKAEIIFAAEDAHPVSFAPAPSIKLPNPLDEPCEECDGLGTSHDCPTCHCVCSFCGGSAKKPPYKGVLVALGNIAFNANYIALIITLPALELSTALAEDIPMRFRFEGGEGLVMPLKGKHASQVKVDWPSQPETK